MWCFFTIPFLFYTQHKPWPLTQLPVVVSAQRFTFDLLRSSSTSSNHWLIPTIRRSRIPSRLPILLKSNDSYDIFVLPQLIYTLVIGYFLLSGHHCLQQGSLCCRLDEPYHFILLKMVLPPHATFMIPVPPYFNFEHILNAVKSVL